MIWSQSCVELQDIVMSWGHCALTHRLRHQEEVKELWFSQLSVHNGARAGVREPASLVPEESLLNPLCHYNEDKLGPGMRVVSRVICFISDNKLQLSKIVN